MTVEKILREWLVAHRCDGLCGYDECGCGIDDFMPCGCSGLDCVAAKSGPVPDGEDADTWFYPYEEASEEEADGSGNTDV